ncbi:TPA: AAA family ATPase [Streptococcus suis]|uniref:UvrD-helicase domain-containing protein n=1 Tax=Streptococcus suis TaxID=1307 RepID=UPI000CF584A3|nr:UvrD-helicase domain-containing protein [Streptococcus suis]NQK15781.1 AAA family ATPase [Streptococcus suis]HEM5249834.1 AAA family ATPase [Streptococcus suis]HEM5312140.1 AAA family ATPase [Streptococcus suis]
MHKLTGEQSQILYLKDNSNLALFGTAGSGKSLIALYKAIYLSIKEPTAQISIICFNNPVIMKLKSDYEKICAELGVKTANNIHISTYHKFIAQKLKEIKCAKAGQYVKEGNKTKYIRKAIEKLKTEYPGNKLLDRDIQFFEEEISWLQGMNLRNVEAYQSAERIGRGRKNPVTKGEDREIVYRVFNGYRYYREENNEYSDYDDISWLVLDNENMIREEHRIDYLIIDEFQDMDKAKIQSLTSFVKNEGTTILLGDYAQQILGTRVSFKQLGIPNISKRTFVKNYRNTQQISSLANSLIERGFIKEDDDEKIRRVSGSRAGGLPILEKVEQSDYVKFIERFFFEKTGRNGLIIMEPRKYKEIKKIIKNKNIELYTINQVKGLEFDNLLILDVDGSLYLEDKENLDSNENSEIAKQLYVAITRATTNLCLGFTDCNMLYYLDEKFVEVVK